MGATTHVPRPKIKETDPGWKGAKTGTKVDMKKGPIKGMLPGNPTKGGGIFRATKGRKK